MVKRTETLFSILFFVISIVDVSKIDARIASLDFASLHKSYVSQYSCALEKESLMGDSSEYYYTSYYLMVMLSAVEASQDEALLKTTMHCLDNMLSKAKDLNGDGYLEWSPLDSNGRPTQLYMYQALGPFARAAAVIVASPMFNAKYQADAQRYIRFVDDHVIQYWYKKVYNSTKVCSGGLVWDDKCSLAGIILASFYQATGDPLHRSLATGLAQSFKGRLQPYGTGWIWDNGIIPEGYGGNYEGVPDTSHANREAMMVVYMHEAGLVFSLQDVERMANTLSDTMWNGSTINPMFANYINGSNVVFSNRTAPGSNGAIYFGWALLGRYSDKAQQAASYLLKAIVEGKSNASGDYNSSAYGKVAVSGDLATNSELGSPYSGEDTP
jgi:hypothetical protein